jgi:hypothetical protein
LAAYSGTGYLYTESVALNWPTAPKYSILRDITDDPIAVYDNYNSGFTLHFRTGTEDLLALAVLNATNGYVYILPGPLKKLSPVTTVVSGTQGLGAYGQLIASSGLATQLNNLANVTFLVPTDAAIAAVQARLSALTQPQLQYLIASYILTTPLYSNLIGAAPLTDLWGGSVPVVATALPSGEFTNKARNDTLVLPNDATTLNGPIQAISSFTIPATFPATLGFPTNLAPANKLAGAPAAVTTIPAAAGSTAATATKSTTVAALATRTSTSETPKSDAKSQKTVGVASLALIALAIFL